MSIKNSDKLISWPKYVLIISGFWNLPITESYFWQTLFKIYSVLARSGYILFWLLLGGELLRLINGNYPSALIIRSLGVLVNATKIGVKILIFLKNNTLDMFRDVIEKEKEVWESKNEKIRQLYEVKILICKVAAVALSTGTVLTVVFLEVNGALATVQLKRHNQANNETQESHFMYMTLYPRDKFESLYITFVSQFMYSWWGASFNVTTHLVFITLLTYAAARLEILQVRLRNYIEDEFSEEEMDGKVRLFKSLILEHKYIIGFVENLKQGTKYIVMLEFVLSSLDIASVSVNLMKGDSSEKSWLAFFFVLLSLQIFILGWTCNEIKVQSEAIASALYESKWYLLNKEGKQLTLIMMAQTQRPLTMTIGPFGPMTNNSALLVMKAAYSYVSIMGK